MADKIEIVAQLIGLKNLKAVGGWRLEVDLFESRIEDILKTTILVNARQNVKILIEPLDDKPEKEEREVR